MWELHCTKPLISYRDPNTPGFSRKTYASNLSKLVGVYTPECLAVFESDYMKSFAARALYDEYKDKRPTIEQIQKSLQIANRGQIDNEFVNMGALCITLFPQERLTPSSLLAQNRYKYLKNDVCEAKVPDYSMPCSFKVGEFKPTDVIVAKDSNSRVMQTIQEQRIIEPRKVFYGVDVLRLSPDKIQPFEWYQMKVKDLESRYTSKYYKKSVVKRKGDPSCDRIPVRKICDKQLVVRAGSAAAADTRFKICDPLQSHPHRPCQAGTSATPSHPPRPCQAGTSANATPSRPPGPCQAGTQQQQGMMRGLINNRSHCGINSVVQCLYATRELVECRDREVMLNAGALANRLWCLFHKMQKKGRLDSCSPVPLIEAMAEYSGTTFNDQEDVDYIFKCIVNALEDQGDNATRNAVSNIWTITRRYRMRCTGCEEKQMSFDKTNTFHVYMDRECKDLQSYIDRHSESFAVSDYYCAKCAAVTKLEVIASLVCLPAVLCVTIGRVQRSSHSPFELTKLFTNFAFQETIDLSNRATPTLPARAMYRLYAVITHTGTPTQGHYKAYVKHNGEWYCADDTHVSWSSWDRVKLSYGATCMYSEVAYMLMYRHASDWGNM
uniref:USP domain-containing protein n=1 Tax=Amphilophus citrinellus TaxID=61819 RepID=A0A3Q0TGZ3_AMPCI